MLKVSLLLQLKHKYKILAEYLKLHNGVYLFNLNVINKRRYELMMDVSLNNT